VNRVDDPDPDTHYVIRTHGIAKQMEEQWRQSGYRYIDATCPFVKKCHHIIERLAGEGIPIILIGDRGHPEIIASSSYAEKIHIVNSREEARNLGNMKQAAVVAQTTLDFRFFKEIVSIIIENMEELRVYNTICKATMVRQNATREMAGRMDIMIVIGGVHSSNSQKLFDISRRRNPHTFFIQRCSDLEGDPRFHALLQDCTSVGITGGASTPSELIDETRGYIKEKLYKEK
jgi:4-hydroxy-3-methylbut-2-enyl diphosphate reductase